ncbi:hypothetical protein Tco_0357866, partial [Tanacetum coccineum]
MNYIPVSVENQSVVDAGVQDTNTAGTSAKKHASVQAYVLHPQSVKIPTNVAVQDTQKKPSEDDKTAQESEDSIEQTWQDELEQMLRQEMVAQSVNNAARLQFEEDRRRNESSKAV